jgi:hypothetical protein
MASDKPTKKELDQNSYEYDVAFSFLSQDEALATEINDLLQDRLKTFLYSKKQEALAGTDGEETFNGVFGEKSRIVVVLYRSGWGKTSWTRVEEKAIRNRAHEHGYDFAIFIPLDEPPIPPKWLPKPRLWVDLKRWGANGAASVIEARVQEHGGKPHEETVVEQAARLERSIKFAERRDEFFNSPEGVSVANQEFEVLDKELQRLVSEINNSISLNIKQDIRPRLAEKKVVILGFGLGLSINWKCPFINVLDKTELIVEFWEGHPPFPGISLVMNFEDYKLKSLKFTFYLTPSEKHVWHQHISNKQYGTKELASFILTQFIQEIKNRSIRA